MAVHFFKISPKTLIVMILYLCIMYTTVGAFSASYETFKVKTYDIDLSTPGVEAPTVNESVPHTAPGSWVPVDYWSHFVNFWGGIWDAWGDWLRDNVPLYKEVATGVRTIANFFIFLFEFFTFSLSVPGMPIWLSWIPFLMVLPVWCIIMVWVAGLAMDLSGEVSSFLKGVIP